MHLLLPVDQLDDLRPRIHQVGQLLLGLFQLFRLFSELLFSLFQCRNRRRLRLLRWLCLLLRLGQILLRLIHLLRRLADRLRRLPRLRRRISRQFFGLLLHIRLLGRQCLQVLLLILIGGRRRRTLDLLFLLDHLLGAFLKLFRRRQLVLGLLLRIGLGDLLGQRLPGRLELLQRHRLALERLGPPLLREIRPRLLHLVLRILQFIGCIRRDLRQIGLDRIRLIHYVRLAILQFRGIFLVHLPGLLDDRLLRFDLLLNLLHRRLKSGHRVLRRCNQSRQLAQLIANDLFAPGRAIKRRTL